MEEEEEEKEGEELSMRKRMAFGGGYESGLGKMTEKTG